MKINSKCRSLVYIMISRHGKLWKPSVMYDRPRFVETAPRQGPSIYTPPLDDMPSCGFDLLDTSERQLRHFLAMEFNEPTSEEMGQEQGTMEYQYDVQMTNGRSYILSNLE